MKKSLGIIGCGSVVQNMYVYSIPGWPHIEKIYVHDVDPQQSERVALTLNATVSGLENLIQKADIIIIASPPHTHYNLLKQCLQKDKTVICEKPFLFHIAEAREIVKAAKANGTKLFVAHMRRVLPAINLAKQMFESHVLGEIKELQLFEGMRFAYQTQSGYETQNEYGGVLLDTGSHTLDAALYITGLDEKELQVEEAVVERDKHEPAHEIKANFTLKFLGGQIPVKLILSRKQVLSNKINIICEHGVLEVPLGLENTVRVRKEHKKAFVAHAPYQVANYHQVLAMQYNIIFDDSRNHIFRSERFIGLTGILEKLLAV
ncbi:MAG: Gfo/Idh/MocA family protein [Bacteroidia bacterium]